MDKSLILEKLVTFHCSHLRNDFTLRGRPTSKVTWSGPGNEDEAQPTHKYFSHLLVITYRWHR